MWEDKKLCICNYKISLFSASSYLIDWVIYMVLFVFGCIIGCITTPKRTDFSITDISILHTYKPENQTYAPLWYLFVLITIIPITVIIICTCVYLRDKNKKRMLWDVHMAILGSFGCVVSQLLLVVTIKNTAGVLRPDFLSRCDPDYLKYHDLNQLFNVDICTNQDMSLLNEGLRSFPSGHSSTIFASQTFLSLFLIGKIKVTSKNYFGWKLIVAVLYPLTVSLKVSFSRISDARHRVIDILMGILVGFCFGFFFYFLYFSTPFGDKMSVAIPPRKFHFIEENNKCYRIELSFFNIDDDADNYNDTNNSNDNNIFFKQSYTEAVDEANIMKLSKPLSKHHSTLPVTKKKKTDRSVSNPTPYFNIV